MRKPIDLSAYRRENRKTLPVFRLQAKSHSSPIDINLRALTDESGWALSDRFRFWHALREPVPAPPPGLTIRKLDLEEKALVRCRVEVDGTLEILSNNEVYAGRFFRTVFVDRPGRISSVRNWTIRKRWTRDRITIGFFQGQVDAALGWGPKIPNEIESSLTEAFSGLERRNWKSCVVMCRRALQALMETAHENTFGAKPGKGLDLNGLIKKFEALTPLVIPKHWLNIADAIRNLGNIPGAHPRPVPAYRFSKRDATLTYSNTSAFVEAYFGKML